METFLDILKYILPSLVVFLTTYYVVKFFLKNSEQKQIAELEAEQKKRLLEIKLNGEKQITPIKLQAYERLVLFLERISPNSLVLRENKPLMPSAQLHAHLLLTVRKEYEHNIAQQLYVSDKAWEWINKAKEDTQKLINTAAMKMDAESKGSDLCQKILELAYENDKIVTEDALNFLKNEIREFLK